LRKQAAAFASSSVLAQQSSGYESESTATYLRMCNDAEAQPRHAGELAFKQAFVIALCMFTCRKGA
jgi:hypothetical protein